MEKMHNQHYVKLNAQLWEVLQIADITRKIQCAPKALTPLDGGSTQIAFDKSGG